jgi:transposase-like protein
MASEVSPDLISQVTDAVLEDVREWRNRRSIPLIPSSSSTRSG